jgi:DNA processing protein
MTVDQAEETLARVHLSAALEPGQPVLLEAVRAVGALVVVDRLRRGDSILDADGRNGRRLGEVDPRAVLDRSADLGMRFLTPTSDAWPVSLDDLAGQVRDRRGSVPVGIWVRGELDPSRLARSTAIVGSRAATAYGTGVATEWAAALTEDEVVVVSGAAYGVDAAAHRGALAVGGPTVAVVAGGLDQAYPRGNAALIDRIASGGLVVSEAAPGSVINRGRFLSRNRLIAALAGGTVVVEAGARSGALSTARWASELLRPLAAVPGPVTSSMSVGTHQLLRDQQAVLVNRPADVTELVGRLGADASVPMPTAPRPTDGLSEPASTVHDALPTRGTVTVAELIASTGLAVSRLLPALSELAERGLVEGSADVWRRRAPRRRTA